MTNKNNVVEIFKTEKIKVTKRLNKHLKSDETMSSKLNYRQELTNKANDYLSKIDITEEIDDIKNKLDDYFDKREYTISLIRVNKGCVAIGGDTSIKSIFIPHNIDPLYYRQLFINELQKLGFSEEYMELSINKGICSDSYIIKLKW